MPKNHHPTERRPPRWANRLLESFCASRLLEEVQGDLYELYGEWAEEYGERKARWLYAWHTIKFFRLFALKRRTDIHLLNQLAMIKNYLKVGIRNIFKYKVFSFINVFGLAVAMSVCMLIILMLADQKSYDQFHAKKDRTYRILSKIKESAVPNATSPFPLADIMREDYPIVEAATHLIPNVGGDVTYGQKTVEMRGFFADASFFEVFDFALEEGDAQEALASPNTMVISQELARQLFGEEEAVGKRVEYVDRELRLLKLDFGSDPGHAPVEWGSFTITGVINPDKYKSHIRFEMLVSAASLPILYRQEKKADFSDNWRQYSHSYTYLVLKPDVSEQQLTTALDNLVAQKYREFEELKGIQMIPQNLTAINPGKFAGNPISLHLPIEAYYFLGFLALVIMFSACLNYTNLSIARALTRAREIGVRKVTGAKRRDLIFQFLSESVLTVLFALMLAYLLLMGVKPAFMELWANKYLNFDLQGNGLVYLGFLGLALIIGLMAGTYPAMYLSRYSPTKVLKNFSSEKVSKQGMRKFLSTFQFVVSLFFIITSLLIYHQFRHYLDFEYGFASENLMNIPTQGNDYQKLKTEFSTLPGVVAVSASAYIPATAMSNGTIGVRKADSEDEWVSFEHMSVDSSFVSNFGLSLVAGRNLPMDRGGSPAILVNEAAARALGYQHPSEAIGALLKTGIYTEPAEVVGVMKDFKFQTPVMEDGIGPLLFRYEPERFSYLNVKIASADIASTLAALETRWKNIDPVHSFNYYFFDDQLVQVNQWLGDLVSVISFIAFLAIVIACLGMLGIATYTAERKTKEVGIRKVLGAAELSIALLLSRGFLATLAIAVAIGAPISYFINQLWLQNFPNRVHFGWSTILLGSTLLLVLGLLTIGSQTIRAARQNPVDTLRTE
uniref:ABC transporter permease n=1 Tax=Roseihalotalea indica TaxID=2867963 RepID=A0AA49JJ78_9BACT|nr:ABC transporter permease [Tunicatimonas sp. TK19036]